MVVDAPVLNRFGWRGLAGNHFSANGVNQDLALIIVCVRLAAD
jgi:hypothetical protein